MKDGTESRRKPDLQRKLLELASNAARSPLLSKRVKTDSRQVYVMTSPVHGMGLFARRTFYTGEIVLVREERLLTPEEPLDAEKGEVEQHCALLEGGRLVYLGYPARFVNHSCDPNCFLRYDRGVGHIVALRPIRPHEEIATHYGVDRSGAAALECRCGSERCIGMIPGSFFELPLDTQLELSPFLSEWFVQEHRQSYLDFLEKTGLAEELLS